MALRPKVKISQLNTCDKLDIFETTLPYSTANVTGWGNTNIDTSNITDARIEIFDQTGLTLLETIILFDGATDVYSGVPGSPTPGEFFALADVEFAQPDGVYKIVYTITDDSESPNKFLNDLQHELFICNLCNCINNIKAKLVTECDSVALQKYNDNLDQLELIKYGIEAAFSCGNFTKATNLINSATKICDNLCDCGCGDC
jgi:hypothetical protein